MKSFIQSKKQLAFVTFTFLAIVFSALLYIKPLDNYIIKIIEQCFNKTLRDPARWIDIIKNTSHIFVFILCLIYYLNFTNSGISIKQNISKTCLELKSNYLNKNALYIFLFLCGFFLIAYYGIISANYFYADDIFRNYGGNRSWIGFSRYISEFFSVLIHNNLKLNDIAPLTQFISIAITCITVMILSVSLTENLKIKTLAALSLVFIAPFYAENISYRFDCPYMAMSLLFSALPFLFKNNKKTFAFVSVVSLTLTCFSYQAALSLYILCVIFIFAIDILNKKDLKDNFIFVLNSVVSFVAALLIFKLFFMNKMTNDADDYFSTKIKISAFIKNSINYIKMTFANNGGLLLKGLFVISIVLLIINIIRFSKKNKILSAIVAIALITISYILSFGPYLVFERPVMEQRAFMGFNAFFALILLANLVISEKINAKSNKTALVLTTITVYSCIALFYTYGNCLKNQKAYENFRTTIILKDLAEITDKNKEYNISIEGDIGLTQKNRIAIKNYPIINSLISPRPSKQNIWNEELFNSYNFNCTTEQTELSDQFVLTKQTYYHDIYQNENNFIIVIK